ncbi:MAG: hypothetical protein E7H57_07725 [Pantoea sp.]|nr:hypothetical protein [Pantoea sp.]
MSSVSAGNTVNSKLFNAALNSLGNDSRVKQKTLIGLLNSVGNQTSSLKEYNKDDIKLDFLSKKEAESLLKTLKRAKGVYDKQHSRMPVKGEVLDALKESAQQKINAELVKENVAAAENIKSKIQEALATIEKNIQSTTLSLHSHEGNKHEYIKLNCELNKIKMEIENLLLENKIDPFSPGVKDLFDILNGSHKVDVNKTIAEVAENIVPLKKLTGKSSSEPVFKNVSNQIISLSEKYIEVNKEVKSVYHKMVANLNPKFKRENPASIKIALNNKLEVFKEQSRMLHTAMVMAEKASNNPTGVDTSEMLKNLNKNLNFIKKD